VRHNLRLRGRPCLEIYSGAIPSPPIITSVKGNSSHVDQRHVLECVYFTHEGLAYLLTHRRLLYQSSTVELPIDPNHFI